MKNFRLLPSFLVIIILSLILFILIEPALAVGLGSSNWGDLDKQMQEAGNKGFGAQPSSNSMAQIIAAVIKAFLGLLGVIFVVLIIYAGYSWMTAQGEEEKVNKAKDTLRQAVIGLIIITAAYAITYFVFSNLPGGGAGGAGGTGGSALYP